MGLSTDEDYRTSATQILTASSGDSASASASAGASSKSNGQSSVAYVCTTSESSPPTLRKVVLDWEKEGLSWNADGSLVFKLDDDIINS